MPHLTEAQPTKHERLEAPSIPIAQRSYFDLALTVARHRKPVCAIPLLSGLIAAVIALLLPNVYTGTTRILPPQQSSSTALSMLGQLSPLLNVAAGKDLGIRNQTELYAALLRSRTIEDRLVDRFGLMAKYSCKLREDARRRLESNTDIAAGKEGLISISVDDRDPVRAADLANGYVVGLRELMQTLAVSDAAKQRLFFEREVKAASDELANAEEAMKVTEERTGMIQLDGQSKVMLESLARLRAEVTAKEVQVQAMRSYATSENPDLKFAEEQLAALRTQMANLQRGGGADSATDLGLRKVPSAGLAYVRRLREVKYRETLLEFLTKQYEAARVDESKDAALIQVVDVASVPERRTRPQRAAIILVAIFSGLALAIGWAFANEAWEHAKQDPERVARWQLVKSYLFSSSSRS